MKQIAHQTARKDVLRPAVSEIEIKDRISNRCVGNRRNIERARPRTRKTAAGGRSVCQRRLFGIPDDPVGHGRRKRRIKQDVIDGHTSGIVSNPIRGVYRTVNRTHFQIRNR